VILLPTRLERHSLLFILPFPSPHYYYDSYFKCRAILPNSQIHYQVNTMSQVLWAQYPGCYHACNI
jgi:hypothetical protein